MDRALFGMRCLDPKYPPCIPGNTKNILYSKVYEDLWCSWHVCLLPDRILIYLECPAICLSYFAWIYHRKNAVNCFMNTSIPLLQLKALFQDDTKSICEGGFWQLRVFHIPGTEVLCVPIVVTCVTLQVTWHLSSVRDKTCNYKYRHRVCSCFNMRVVIRECRLNGNKVNMHEYRLLSSSSLSPFLIVHILKGWYPICRIYVNNNARVLFYSQYTSKLYSL